MTTEGLSAFFANRVLSTHLSTFSRYLDWLGLASVQDEEIPLEILARTGGSHATDTFHVVAQGTLTSRFFASGLRYSDEVDAVLAQLSSGDKLRLELEPENPKNADAVLILSINGAKIGYVPDWLCGEVNGLINAGWAVNATVERVNPEAPRHVQLLVRLDAEPD